MAELHPATVIADVDLAGDVEFPVRLAATPGLLRGTFAKLKTWLMTTFTVGDLFDVDLTGLADGDTLVWDAGATEWVPGAGGGGGGGGGSSPCPAIRSTDIVATGSVGSYTVNLPAGAAAGDFCVIIHAGGFGIASITSPSTAVWDTYQQGATNFGGTIFSRRLSAADVTAGSVTITPGGTYYNVAVIICFTGDAKLRFPEAEFAARNIAIRAPGAGATASTVTTRYIDTDDCVLLFFGNRATSNNTTAYGTALETVNSTDASGSLYAEEAPTAGGQSATLAYSTAGSGRYEILLVVRGPN